MHMFEYVSYIFTFFRNGMVILLDFIALISYGFILLFTKKQNEELVYPSKSATGIVLIHGSGADSREFIAGIEYMKQYMKRTGYDYNIFVFNYTQDKQTSIESLGETLKNKLIEWARNHNIQYFVLVGHSLGGLVGVVAMNNNQENTRRNMYEFSVIKLITINTPWQGARILSQCPKSWKSVIQQEMEPYSTFLTDLNEHTEFKNVLSMNSPFDFLVDISHPFKQSKQNMITTNILSGHYSIVAFSSVWDQVLDNITTT